MKNNFSPFDHVVYYIMAILTLGSVFFTKVIVKKAIQEMLSERKEAK